MVFGKTARLAVSRPAGRGAHGLGRGDSRATGGVQERPRSPGGCRLGEPSCELSRRPRQGRRAAPTRSGRKSRSRPGWFPRSRPPSSRDPRTTRGRPARPRVVRRGGGSRAGRGSSRHRRGPSPRSLPGRQGCALGSSGRLLASRLPRAVGGSSPTMFAPRLVATRLRRVASPGDLREPIGSGLLLDEGSLDRLPTSSASYWPSSRGAGITFVGALRSRRDLARRHSRPAATRRWSAGGLARKERRVAAGRRRLERSCLDGLWGEAHGVGPPAPRGRSPHSCAPRGRQRRLQRRRWLGMAAGGWRRSSHARRARL